MLPTAGRTYSQERKGIAAVQSFAASKDQIWRETSTGDVGIDGQLEYVNDGGHATGKLVAVQVNSRVTLFPPFRCAHSRSLPPVERQNRSVKRS
jgi:hypothetical protein